MEQLVKNAGSLEYMINPMRSILDSKNIINCMSYVIEDDKIFFIFEQDFLSETNKKLLMGVSTVYSNIIFYSNDKEKPRADQYVCWIPEEAFDEKYKVRENCLKKKFYVLELPVDDHFIILGTTIMLANIMQEQDPLALKANEDKDIYTDDEIRRHEHYLKEGCPDHKWLCLNILLDKDNPLNDNMYAPYHSVCEMNSEFAYDNTFDAILFGGPYKKILYFDMNQENLEKVVKEYYTETYDMDVDDKIDKIEAETIKKLVYKNN